MRTLKSMVMLFSAACLASHAVAAADVHVLAFEENRGQWGPDVRFAARARQGLIALYDEGSILIPLSSSGGALRMAVAGSSKHPQIEGVDPLAQRTNYFIGRDPASWQSDVRTWRGVAYRGIYRGVDAVFYSGPSGELEYDFVVHPGGDPRDIRLRFDGSQSIAITRSGELVIAAGGDTVRMKPPVAYQVIDGARFEVEGRYRLRGRRTVAFELGAYDHREVLVVDPVVLGYSTFLGGSGEDLAFGIAVDAERNSYVVGITKSANFPTGNALQPAIAGGQDLFIAKLNPAGNEILFTTFLGGIGEEAGGTPSIAVDSRGDIYVSGSTTSLDFPVTEGASQTSFGGGPRDVFVSKLSSDGSRLLFSSYLGGEDADIASGLAVDAKRDIYVAGRTRSSRFPLTEEAVQTNLRGTLDAFVTKFRADPASLVYSTYLGGSDEDFVFRLAVDASGAAYVTGKTFSTDYPTTHGAFQRAFAGAGIGNLREGDVFVTKIDPAGSSLVYSTFLGGSSGEFATSIGLDSAGCAYVAGLTYSRDFPTTSGSFQPWHGGGDADNFVTKLAPEGDRLIYSSYLGGNNSEQANALAVDRLGRAHVSGSTSSPNFPTTDGALSRTRKGTGDAFVSSVSADGANLLYSSYIGGTAPTGGPQDNAWALAVDHAANVYLAGQTRSADFPVTAEAPQPLYAGLDEAFVTKLTWERDALEGERRVIPVVGSTPGSFGSFFKTSVQLHNPRITTIAGRLIFHPQGRSGTADDPFLDYFLAPGETMAISDLLPAMSQSGLGSIDLATPEGQAPESVIRIYNDAGPAGTTGMSQEPMRNDEILKSGTTAVLIAPISLARARFNVGIRTLGDGASLTITLRRHDGTVVHTTSRAYPSDFFEQRRAEEFLGTPLEASDSIALRIDSGSAVIYGATTDNITQDPSLQLARAADSASGEMRILPVIGSTPGAFGSFFKTAVQLHNPGENAISGRIVYHAQGTSGSAEAPTLDYELGPGETIAFGDLLPAMGLAGLGSADIISTEGPLPLSVVRVFNDGRERGTTGLTEDQVSLAEVLRQGDESVLITPPDPAKARYNIGIRTVEEGATITATVRNGWGTVVHEVTKSFPPVFFNQMAAAALLETELEGNESIRFRVDAGGVIVYSATTDNITQDPTMKVARRVP